MQTFLPEPVRRVVDFEMNAKRLDNRRLGKQRLECLQILRTLNGETSGWRNHPVVKMWHGFVEALVEYGVYICDEWTQRGYVDNLKRQITTHSWGDEVVLPPWCGDLQFHQSHQSNLLRKDFDHYSQFGWNVSADLPYVWPVQF